MMVSRGNYPQMTLVQVGECYLIHPEHNSKIKENNTLEIYK